MKVAEAVAAAESVGVQVDREIAKVLKAQDHYRLAQNINEIKEQIEGVQKQLETLVGKIKQLEGEMLGQGMYPASSWNMLYTLSVARMLPSIVDFVVMYLSFF